MLESNTRVFAKQYREPGGKITVIVKEGTGHYPLGPDDPKAVVDFMAKNAR
ncbi:MAG: hypothetical protein ACI92G_002709 [Candidatus Pelagisphaera sp.]